MLSGVAFVDYRLVTNNVSVSSFSSRGMIKMLLLTRIFPEHIKQWGHVELCSGAYCWCARTRCSARPCAVLKLRPYRGNKCTSSRAGALSVFCQDQRLHLLAEKLWKIGPESLWNVSSCAPVLYTVSRLAVIFFSRKVVVAAKTLWRQWSIVSHQMGHVVGAPSSSIEGPLPSRRVMSELSTKL